MAECLLIYWIASISFMTIWGVKDERFARGATDEELLIEVMGKLADMDDEDWDEINAMEKGQAVSKDKNANDASSGPVVLPIVEVPFTGPRKIGGRTPAMKPTNEVVLSGRVRLNGQSMDLTGMLTPAKPRGASESQPAGPGQFRPQIMDDAETRVAYPAFPASPSGSTSPHPSLSMQSFSPDLPSSVAGSATTSQPSLNDNTSGHPSLPTTDSTNNTPPRLVPAQLPPIQEVRAGADPHELPPTPEMIPTSRAAIDEVQASPTVSPKQLLYFQTLASKTILENKIKEKRERDQRTRGQLPSDDVYRYSSRNSRQTRNRTAESTEAMIAGPIRQHKKDDSSADGSVNGSSVNGSSANGSSVNSSQVIFDHPRAVARQRRTKNILVDVAKQVLETDERYNGYI